MVRIGFLTCVFLIGLRLAIGWHVSYEGLNKYESAKRGDSELSKPFSSRGYFAEAEGPVGPHIREWLAIDADQNLLAKLKLKESDSDKPFTKMPAALEKDWDEYARQFESYFKLTDDEKKEVANRLEKAKMAFVEWRTDSGPPPKGEPKAPDEAKKITFASMRVALVYRPENKVMQRCNDYEMAVREIRYVYENELPKMGRDVEKSRLREMKSTLAAIRADLTKEVNSQTVKMRQSLAKVIEPRLAAVDFGPTDSKLDGRVLAMLTPADGGMPVPLEKQWNDYFEVVRTRSQEKFRNDPQRGDSMLADAKVRYVRYLSEKNEYSGDPLSESQREYGFAKRLELYGAAVKRMNEALEKAKADPNLGNILKYSAATKEPAPYRQEFMADIRRHTDILRQNLGGFVSDKDLNRFLDPAAYVDESLPFDNLQGTIRPEKETTRFLWIDWPTSRLEWMNWATRWGLLIGGLCILFGLFTRLACFGVAMFLLIEILSNTPLPWLPTSPKSEGSYAFVNKNSVEMIALLALCTLPTGRWFGLDALLSCLWPFRRKSKPAAA